jgi:DNA mismatch repair ATPase MutS
MYKAKHSKFRNTGLLFELLTRQVTADILAGKDESPAKNLLFKYFSPNTELGREWQLYNFLVNERAKDETLAEKYISITLKQREKLDNKKLTEQKYNLIKEINDVYSAETLLKSSLKNYKLFASVYKLFEDHINNKIKFDIQEVIQARNFISENLCGIKKKSPEAEEEVIKIYKQQSEDIRMLSYKIMVDSLNEKYQGLDQNQKRLLREFINNITNTNSLNVLINEEVETVKKELTELSSQVDSDVIRIKITETVKQLDKVKPSKSVKDNQVMVLLLSYELIKEIKSQI